MQLRESFPENARRPGRPMRERQASVGVGRDCRFHRRLALRDSARVTSMSLSNCLFLPTLAGVVQLLYPSLRIGGRRRSLLRVQAKITAYGCNNYCNYKAYL